MRAAGPLLVVAEDPLRGLENMGAPPGPARMRRSSAVTGSVGKTSTKEMLRAALSASGETHASAASFNNHWGVPLTLARMPREAAFGVFEIGMNHAGEITPLVGMVRPHVAIVTTIAASHLGHFNSLDEIADAKAEIFTGVVPGGTAVINRDTPYFDRLSTAARATGHRQDRLLRQACRSRCPDRAGRAASRLLLHHRERHGRNPDLQAGPSWRAHGGQQPGGPCRSETDRRRSGPCGPRAGDRRTRQGARRARGACDPRRRACC